MYFSNKYFNFDQDSKTLDMTFEWFYLKVTLQTCVPTTFLLMFMGGGGGVSYPVKRAQTESEDPICICGNLNPVISPWTRNENPHQF
jgi:hypothetical protein